jgi:hypothetical protein
MPKIGIYTGRGSSHSWLWFADLFERFGCHRLSFLSEKEIQGGGLKNLEVLAMSGGDTFAIAAGLGRSGAEKLRAFMENGGIYLGSCAGAYLPLYSSKPPLSWFNWVPARITNLAIGLHQDHGLQENSITPYGCGYIFHPVREEVLLEADGIPPFKGAGIFPDPLYGGPAMIPQNDLEVLAYYGGFTPKTRFLVDQAQARETLLGKAAAIRFPLGKGKFYLFGPHFEHPSFPKANQLLMEAIRHEQKSPPKNWIKPQWGGTAREIAGGKDFLRDLKREISNARIVAVGLEQRSIQWKVGNKIYDPLKFRTFLEAVWKRIRSLEKKPGLYFRPGANREITQAAAGITLLLRRIKQDLDQNRDTYVLAERTLGQLRTLAAQFLSFYFTTLNHTVKDSGKI